MRTFFSKSYLLILCLLSTFNLSAQNDKGNLIGRMYHGFTRESEKFLSTDGATIRLVTGKDTLYKVSIGSSFNFEKIPLGKAQLKITHINFEPFDTLIDIKKRTEILAILKERVVTLNEIRVKADIPMIIRSGDTIKFNAAAVKQMEGDVALEVLKQMPGVEISESGIKVYGKDIERTYVNSKLIFGKENKMNALENIPASEVVSIDTYEEHKDLNKSYHSKREDKVRVLNIKTKNPIFGATTMQAILSGGHDFDKKGENRYAAGLSSNFYSEDLLFSLSALTNNNNKSSVKPDEMVVLRPSSSYTKSSLLEGKIDKTWKKVLYLDEFRVEAGANYNNSDTKRNSISKYIYFPTEQYTRREKMDSSVSLGGVSDYSVYSNIFMNKKNIFNISSANKYSSSDSYSDYLRSGYSILNDEIINNQSFGKQNSNRYSFNSSTHVILERKFYSMISMLNITNGNNSGEGFAIDSLASTGLRRVIESGPIGKNHSVLFNSRLSRTFEKGLIKMAGFIYNYSDSYRKSRMFVSDITNPSEIYLDTVKSYNYTESVKAHKIGVFTALQLNESTNLLIEGGYNISEMGRDEEFPLEQQYNRRQHAFLPSFNISKKLSSLSALIFNYQSSVTSPSTEQWRDYLDTKNPYQLSAGNPNLKQSYNHMFNMFLNLYGKRGNSIMIGAELTLRNNSITNKTLFFTENTVLDKWGGYLAEAQSTLTTYENLNGYVNGSFIINNTITLKEFLKGRLGYSVRYQYSRDPSFLQEDKIFTQSHIFTISSNFNSNSSTKYKYGFNPTFKYITTNNSVGQNSDFIQLSLGVNSNINITKNLYISSMYNLAYNKRISSNSSDNTQHILNGVIGYKFLKSNASLSISANDILNRSSGFSTTMNENYVLNKWNSNFGRFFTVNFAYKFYKSKKGLKMPMKFSYPSGVETIIVR